MSVGFADAGALAESLLGAHVGGGAEQLAGQGVRTCSGVASEAEVHDVGVSGIVDQDVLRLEVAVHDALGVSMCNRRSDLRKHAHGTRRSEGTVGVDLVG
jgi:hypothetical protein